jgi:hypothetical protein
VQKLRHFHELIDLQQVAPGVHPSARKKDEEDLDKLLHLLGRFHRVAQRLRDRHGGRDTLEIKDEYDVQDLLYGLLQIDFDDVRAEESSPSHVGGNSRIDFVLRLPGILLEAKMTSAQLRDKKLGDELLIDIGRYKEYPGIQHFVIFIYDRADHVGNKQGMIRDLVRHSTPQFRISVVVNPS